VLFKETSLAASQAQIAAFEDTWHWADAAQHAFEQVAYGPNDSTARVLKAMVDALGRNDVTAYLAMMAIRLLELRRVLKQTGAIYLHCDPTASHYLKLLMDSVYGPTNFRNEIVWKRFSSHGNVYNRYGRIHDIILFYSNTHHATWNQQYRPLSQSYVDAFFRFVEPDTGRRYRLQNVLNPNKDRPNLTYEWNGHVRVWKWTRERMQQIHDAGLLVYSKSGLPKGFKQYLDDSQGEKLQDVWDDIRPLGQTGDIDLGYETQKPLALLERIITSSSDQGSLVLDPFCGCGTAIHAAQKLNRRWIGIDITHLAIGLIRRRMEAAFPGLKIDVVGEPVDLAGAQDLAARDPYQFQWWALDRLGAQPLDDRKKGRDRGIDGVIPFIEGKTDRKRVIVSVKSGNVGPSAIRDLKGVIEREKEPIGVLLTLKSPTREMQTEAASAGSYDSPTFARRCPRIQILTIEQLLAGKRIEMPPHLSPFARPARESQGEQQALPL
jgi:site-specific DNA-methyltransferase (adenine-specific)